MIPSLVATSQRDQGRAALVHLSHPPSVCSYAVFAGSSSDSVLISSLNYCDLLQIEWVKLGGFSQVECDSKGFFVNVTVTSSRHVCAHAKIEQAEAPER